MSLDHITSENGFDLEDSRTNLSQYICTYKSTKMPERHSTLFKNDYHQNFCHNKLSFSENKECKISNETCISKKHLFSIVPGSVYACGISVHDLTELLGTQSCEVAT